MIKIAEVFASLQGEGPSMGVPSVFVRVSGCTLECPQCDTTEVWKQGSFMTNEDLHSKIKECNGHEILKRKGGHLILTGGSPLRVQRELSKWLATSPEWWDQAYDVSHLIGNRYVEVETECMIVPSTQMDQWVDQYNVSPKLGKFGEGQSMNIDALSWHVADHRSIFKFVVDGIKDAGLIREFVWDHNIQESRVWLMPLASTRKVLDMKAGAIAEFCFKHGFNYSHRLQVALWDKTTGV